MVLPHKENNIIDVSIIVVNWNTKNSLRNCLKSIYDHAGDISYEVIAVDNASADGSAGMVREEFPRVMLIANSENKGFAAANNQGMRIARGRYMLLLNSDTIVCDNAVEKTVMYADKHPDVAVVGCQVWENPEVVQMTCFRFPSLTNIFLSTFWLAKVFKHNRSLGREWMLWWKRDTETDVDVVSGMFMLVRRKAIDEVGMMDEAFFVYGEEADWCYRFAEAGWKVRFWPGARIIHVGGGSHSTDQASVAMSVQIQKSLLIFVRKHRGRPHYWVARLMLVISFGLRSCTYAMLFSLKKLTRQQTSHRRDWLARSWAVFKFVAVGIQSGAIRR